MGIPTPDKKLSVREQRFVAHYLSDFNAIKAAKESGYRIGHGLMSAADVLKIPRISAAIAKERAIIEANIEREKQGIISGHGININWKIEKLKQIVEGQLDENPEVAIKAISELNKMQGHYAAEKRENLNVNVERTVEEISQIREKYKRDY